MRRRSTTFLLALLAAVLVAVGCTGSASDDAAEQPAEPSETVDPTVGTTSPGLPFGDGRDFPPAPTAPTGPLDPEVVEAVDFLFATYVSDVVYTEETIEAFAVIGASEDLRTAWWLTDVLRVTASREVATLVGDAYLSLTGVEIDPFRDWTEAVDLLIAWDVPAPPDYLRYKRPIYLAVDERWAPLFADESDVDWRLVSWGGVLIDDRPYDLTDGPCTCIPAADNPAVTDVAGGDEWLDADTVVFGVEIDGDARAYPRSVMEVREMVNDTLGGRDFAMPYCTLCGAAQVFFTDEVAGFDRPVLRTSGLLSRSNKVMYDLETLSVFDTFLGAAVTGPLWEAGVVLPQHSVITTTWGEWKAEHPETSVVDISEALGRPDSDLRNTRDAYGPIFPIGDVDPRLALQDDVLGLVAGDGTPVAFHVDRAIAALERGEEVRSHGIEVILDGGGVRAVAEDGTDLGGHQAFWFAWSQFHPDTELWNG